MRDVPGSLVVSHRNSTVQHLLLLLTCHLLTKQRQVDRRLGEVEITENYRSKKRSDNCNDIDMLAYIARTLRLSHPVISKLIITSFVLTSHL